MSMFPALFAPNFRAICRHQVMQANLKRNICTPFQVFFDYLGLYVRQKYPKQLEKFQHLHKLCLLTCPIVKISANS